MAQLTGAALAAEALRGQGINTLFGVVGYPVTEVAQRFQEGGGRYIGTRHEQTAGFAAQAYGYLKGHVGAALTTTGPGMANAITALGNAWANHWPLLLLAGGSDLRLAHREPFQDAPQRELARTFCKWTGTAVHGEQIPRLVAHAVRQAWYGRPGPVYLELPANILAAAVDESAVEPAPGIPPPPRPVADPVAIDQALTLLRQAQRPLLIVGKGAAWGDAAPELRRFVDATGIPVLPTPMGKGVIPDNHPASVSAARSLALKEADVILAAGARFNWILHFGLPPRYAEDVRVIQIDIAADSLGTNVPVAVGLLGDVKATVGQLVAGLEEHPWQVPAGEAWPQRLAGETAKKRGQLQPLLDSAAVPMGYYRPLRELQEHLPRDCLLIAEGANTMDISRSILENYEPRRRLDAGSWGAMGVGCGYALAAAVAHPELPVLALMGDGAFGFSGMEIEVAVRYQLPITWVVFNNNGIGSGVAELPAEAPPPVQVFHPAVRYDNMMTALGGRGVSVTSPQALGPAVEEALASGVPTLIQVPIDPAAQPFAPRYSWLA